MKRKARYYPLERGHYEVGPGLRPLGFDFGNADLDKKVFQIEDDHQRFRVNKEVGRRERLGKYHLQQALPNRVEAALVAWLLDHLPREWPEYFSRTVLGDRIRLSAHHLSENLECDINGKLLSYQGPLVPPPQEALEALGLMLPEDFSIVIKEGDLDRLALLHLFAPSHWSAEEKIGLDFKAVHRPVAGSERLLKSSASLVEAMITKGPFVRFVWSFVTDDRLNHHPDPPPGFDLAAWRGRTFDASRECPFLLRVERQVLTPFARASAALFSIKISFWTATEIIQDSERRRLLLATLRSMTPEALQYKGLSGCAPDLIAWLESANVSS